MAEMIKFEDSTTDSQERDWLPLLRQMIIHWGTSGAARVRDGQATAEDAHDAHDSSTTD